MEKRQITNLIKKCIFIYLLISLVISVIMGFIYKHFEVSVLSYVFLSFFISIGIKRMIVYLSLLLLLILFFIMDIIKNKKQKLVSIISIVFLLAKIPCSIETMDVWVELTDVLKFITKI